MNTFDTSSLDDAGLLGPLGRKRLCAYEFCIPDVEAFRVEVAAITPRSGFPKLSRVASTAARRRGFVVDRPFIQTLAGY